jgi:hypothetical protein
VRTGIVSVENGTNQGNSVDVELPGYDLQTGSNWLSRWPGGKDVQGVTDAKVSRSRDAGICGEINRRKPLIWLSAYQIEMQFNSHGWTQATSIRRDVKSITLWSGCKGSALNSAVG